MTARALADCPDERQVACIVLDIDHFHDLNAHRGHDVADAVLAATAERIAGMLRSGDGWARVGDDEFAVVLRDLFGPDHALLAAQRILERVHVPLEVDGQALVVRARVGISTSDGSVADGDALLREASVALHRAKLMRREVVIYDRGLDRRVPVARIEQALRAALDQNRVVTHYQPKVRMATGEVYGVEALVRVLDTSGELLMPASFIPVAEQSDLITALTGRVLGSALHQCTRWDEAGLRLQVAVNLSPRTLAEGEALLDMIEGPLELWGVEPERLTLEITESLMVEAHDRSPDVLHTLSGIGVRLSIDDFGQGYSSLAYLQTLPAKELKIDQGFVRGIEDDNGNHTLVRAIIGLGHDFGMEVVAEGVETRDTWDRLKALGCDYAQGRFISWGMDGDVLAERIELWREQPPWA